MMHKKLGCCLALLTAMTLAVSAAPFVSAQENFYRSELTGEWISDSLKDQRPIAVMVDNESISLPHFGTASADVVYELMNSTANQRITRLMVLVKDWGKITQFGNIRSTRSSNIPLAGEWNAILVHDGGPFYVDEYFAKDYAREHLSGGFSRIPNGKPTEFTEYVCTGEIASRIQAANYSATYNSFRNEDQSHFRFVEGEDEVVDLQKTYGAGSIATRAVSLPFYHNSTTLRRNVDTGKYDYYEYGQLYTDGIDGRMLSFDNIILQDTGFRELDGNGYMIYDLIGENQPAYYITRGFAIPVTWTKKSETDITRYYDAAGNEIMMNRGTTYVALIPADTWTEVTLIN
ncbi:MAG: DUF3048 domain-containing protein [Blautia sp.]|nr:DUF3048 domain-containing protein [Blautia sp.]